MTVTKLAQMFDPQVLKDMLEERIGKGIKFAPLAEVDTTLQGRPGSTITVPVWTYIGDAEDVTEGAAIPISQLGQTHKTMTIKKAGKGVELTDEAILSGLGDPIGTAIRQLGKSIDQKVDNDVLEVAKTATQTHTTKKGLTVEDLSAAQDFFENEEDESFVLLCHPKAASKLRLSAGKEWLNATEIGANRIITGTYGEILNTQIVRTKKLGENEAILVQVSGTEEASGTSAFKITLKRETEVEIDRDIKHKQTLFTADRHYGVYLQNDKRVVKLTITPSL